jgi:hypothetical protein
LRRQINRDEWTKAGLDVREKENEPVETAQALPRGRGCRLAINRIRRQRRNAVAGDYRSAVIVINPVNQMG